MKPIVSKEVMEQQYLCAWWNRTESNNSVRLVTIESETFGPKDSPRVHVKIHGQPEINLPEGIPIAELIREDHSTPDGLMLQTGTDKFAFYDPYDFSTRYGNLPYPKKAAHGA